MTQLPSVICSNTLWNWSDGWGSKLYTVDFSYQTDEINFKPVRWASAGHQKKYIKKKGIFVNSEWTSL
jgi:hypothetical protein